MPKFSKKSSIAETTSSVVEPPRTAIFFFMRTEPSARSCFFIDRLLRRMVFASNGKISSFKEKPPYLLRFSDRCSRFMPTAEYVHIANKTSVALTDLMKLAAFKSKYLISQR